MPVAATVQPFVCGGMAACFASSCIHPIDLAKVRTSVSLVHYFLRFHVRMFVRGSL